MKSNILFSGLFFLLFAQCYHSQAQTTLIPNGDFENWITHSGYSDPQYWDTPNEELMSIPIYGQPVVSKSTSSHTGSYSAKLETKTLNIPLYPTTVPGVITLGKLVIDIYSQTYTITGGVPIDDQPTHLKGFFKFLPQGGDSCVIGIALFKTTQGISDTIALGYFSSKTEVPDWTPFYAWIKYDTLTDPDTMNILAISTAQYIMTAGTVLYLDDLSLDYTVGQIENTGEIDISVYQDKETMRLLVFPSASESTSVSVILRNMMGLVVFSTRSNYSGQERVIVPYDNLRSGIYILQVNQGHKKYCQKFFLNP